MKPLLIWLVTLQLLAWLHFPICFRVGRHLRDRGFGLSKLAGVVLAPYVSWLICHGPAAHTRSLIFLVLAGLAAISFALYLYDRNSYAGYFRIRWRYIVSVELIFCLGFLAAAWIRAQVPAIAFDPNWSGAEKWSDYALLSSLTRQLHYPPFDPWLAGFPINYYYFGHLVWATLSNLTGIPPNIAYNLSIATIVALALVLCVSLGYHLFRSLGMGLLLAFLVVLGGNVKPALDVYDRSRDAGHLVGRVDFWDSSRAMDWGPEGLIREWEINEMPSFSFILGDLHPHFSAHPLVLGLLLTLAALWRAGQRRTFSGQEILVGRLSLWSALAFFGGLLYATNSWDCFVGLFLSACVLGYARDMREWTGRGRVVYTIVVLGAVYIVATRVVVLPFAVYFTPPKSVSLAIERFWPPRLQYATPLGIVPPELRSSVAQWMFYFGLFVIPFLAWQTWEAVGRTLRVALDKRLAWFATGTAAGMAVGIELGSGLVGLLVFLFIVLVPGVFRRRRRERLEFVAILTWFGLLVAFLCELFYYNDAFSGENERINTIFKVYYCLWPVMGLAAVAACSALWGGRCSPHRVLRRASASVLMLVLVSVSALYPALAWTTRIRDYRELEIGRDAKPTLDGLAYLETLPGFSDDYEVARWLRENAPPDTVVAEAYDYGYSAAGRFGAIAGIQSLLGWAQHQSTWREGLGQEIIEKRMEDVDTLYSVEMTTQSAEAMFLVLAYNQVDYIAIGTLEWEKYPRAYENLSVFFRPACQSGKTVLFGFSKRARAKAEEVRSR